MSPLPNIRHLHLLSEIAESGSLSKVSEVVHMSQPAITQGLTKIEKTLGTELFERTSKGMVLTPAGSLFNHRVKRAIGFLRNFCKETPSGRPWHQLFSSAQLRAVIGVVEHGNFTVAANALGLAQPTVHRAVRQVEAICGQPLFTRTYHGVDSTAAAHRLARLARLALAELHQGYDEVAEYRGQMTGRLRIGSLPLARTQLVPAAVTQLLQQFPDARVSIIDGLYEQLLDSLMHGRLDCIVGALREPIPTREVTQHLLFTDPLAVVVRAGHPLLRAKNLSLASIAPLNWVAPRQGTPAREKFQALFADHGLDPPVHLVECSSSVATRSLLLQSDRVALLSARQVAPELNAKLLACLPLALNTSRNIGYTLRNHWQPTRIQSHFLSLLDALAKNI